MIRTAQSLSQSLSFFVCAVSLGAQQGAATEASRASASLTAESFLPDEYQSIVFIDLEAIRDRGVWEEVEGSALNLVFKRFEKEWGFGLDDLDRIKLYAEMEEVRSTRNLILYEGNKPLRLEPNAAPGGQEEELTVGRFEVIRTQQGGESLLHVLPSEKLLVVGNEELVEPVLLGKPHRGIPSPDVMSLLSGRGDNLIYLVIGFTTDAMRVEILPKVLPEADWDDGEEPTHLLLRLRTIGDPEDPNVEVQAILRHRDGGKGLAESEEALERWLVRMQEEKSLAPLRSMWQTIEVKRDGRDLVLRKDLGSVRGAIGTVTTMMAAMMRR